ncbi:unnamed protein product, partial [Durusdinium trenchii]
MQCLACDKLLPKNFFADSLWRWEQGGGPEPDWVWRCKACELQKPVAQRTTWWFWKKFLYQFEELERHGVPELLEEYFLDHRNVNHDAWHQRADAPRLGHKFPALLSALLLRLLGCKYFDTPCGGGRWFEAFMEHSRRANLHDVAGTMEKSVRNLWQTLKYSSYDHNEIDAMITTSVQLHSLEKEIWSKV